MLNKKKAIKEIFKKHDKNSIFITNTGFLSRDVFEIFPENRNIFYMQGSMGLSPAIGLGLAMNTLMDVVVLVGDASLLMHLGITHTIRDSGLKNLYVYVLDNGCHESVGAYPCSGLEKSYPGVNEIYKIAKSKKSERVTISPKENVSFLREILNGKNTS